MMAQAPRILFAISSLSAGGAERVVSEIANAWAEKGWQVGILTFSGWSADHYSLHSAISRIKLDLLWDSRSLWRSLMDNWQRSRAIRQAVREFNPEVVISFIDQTNVRILVALVGSGIPVVVSERVDPAQYHIGKIWQLARRLLYPHACKVVVQTDAAANWAKTFLPAEKVRIVPNFVRLLPDAPSWEQRSSHRILAVGRLEVQKGFDLLLRAFAAAKLQARGTRLTILGEGPERERLENLSRELGIAGFVSLPGVVKNPEAWMERCALFALTSRFEGFPNVLLEAMAMGCAVVATDCPSGPAVLVRNEVNGLLVPPEGVSALSDALVRLVDNVELCRRLGVAATSVRVDFGREQVLKQWETLIMNCMSGRRYE